MSLQDRVIQLLSDGCFHSGARMGAELGVSRTAVWQAVRSLSALGLEIHAVPGRGYRLTCPLELLDRQSIVEELRKDTREMLVELEVHREIGSTNSHLMEIAGPRRRSGHVCLAELQRAGRGRRGRRWVSPFGANINCSVSWRFELAPALLSGLSLAVGVAVAQALIAAGATDIGLKWPNDVLWRGRKLAGILTEMSGEAEGPCYVVTGIGINVRMPPGDTQGIDQPWVDMDTVLGQERVSRNRLVSGLLDQVLPAMHEFHAGGLRPFMQDWLRLDVYRGRHVVLHTQQGSVAGQVCGIDDKGGLLLLHEGREQRYESGEVSLRPAQGNGGVGTG